MGANNGVRPRIIGNHHRDSSLESALPDGLNDRLEVGSLAGTEDGNRGGSQRPGRLSSEFLNLRVQLSLRLDTNHPVHLLPRFKEDQCGDI